MYKLIFFFFADLRRGRACFIRGAISKFPNPIQQRKKRLRKKNTKNGCIPTTSYIKFGGESIEANNSIIVLDQKKKIHPISVDEYPDNNPYLRQFETFEKTKPKGAEFWTVDFS